MIQYGVYRLEGRHGKEKKELTGRQQESLCELESKHRQLHSFINRWFNAILILYINW